MSCWMHRLRVCDAVYREQLCWHDETSRRGNLGVGLDTASECRFCSCADLTAVGLNKWATEQRHLADPYDDIQNSSIWWLGSHRWYANTSGTISAQIMSVSPRLRTNSHLSSSVHFCWVVWNGLCRVLLILDLVVMGVSLLQGFVRVRIGIFGCHGEMANLYHRVEGWRNPAILVG